MSERDLDAPPGGEISPKQARAIRQQKITDAKDRGLEVSFDALATELERRRDSGELAKELSTLKIGSLLGNLARAAAAIKSAAVVVIPSNTPTHDPTALRAQSAIHLSEHERLERRRAALAKDAEIIPPEDAP